MRTILQDYIAEDANLMTDEPRLYKPIGKEFARHQTVKHSAMEYARGNAPTNTIERFFSILKRGLIGTFHHVGRQHLKRYVKEFDFRYNKRKTTDAEPTRTAIEGIGGKRLMYRHSSRKQTTLTRSNVWPRGSQSA